VIWQRLTHQVTEYLSWKDRKV